MKYETAVLQDKRELEEFIGILKKEQVQSYLEIGSKFGGSLWKIARALPKGSLIVSVDLPQGDGSFKESQPHLERCIDDLTAFGYDAHLFLGDSTDPTIVEWVAELAPFDACLIDGYHTEPFVRADWKNYGPMARIVAFHDIGWRRDGRDSKKAKIEAPKVWKELKQIYPHREIVHCPRDYGIGVLWR